MKLLHNLYPVLFISKKRILYIVTINLIMVFLWGYLISSGWYKTLGLWQSGAIVGDPHNIVNLVMKELGIFVLYPFILSDGLRFTSEVENVD